MSTAHILVTGGAGYIGSHVCNALKKRGLTPIIVDNLSHGHRSMASFGPFIEGDIGDTDLINGLCQKYRPLAAMHFAALIDVAESVKHPDLFIHNNYEKACLFYESLARNHIDSVVFSSTAAVYGTPTHDHSLSENDPLLPINPYGVSKLKAELALRDLPQIRSVCLRYFNAAGASLLDGLGEAHHPETHLIPRALLALLHPNSNTLRVYGDDYPTIDGTALRDYIHVLDIAEAHLLALDYLLKGHPNLIVNLGSGTGYTVKKILDKIQQITQKEVPFEVAPRRIGDPPFLVANIQKAKEILSWSPRHGLDDIIKSAYEWHASPLYDHLINPLR